MGMDKTHKKVLFDLKKRGYLKDFKSIIELGSQDDAEKILNISQFLKNEIYTDEILPSRFSSGGGRTLLATL